MEFFRKRYFALIMLTVLGCILLSVYTGRDISRAAEQNSAADMEMLLLYDDWQFIHEDNTITPISLPARRRAEYGNSVRLMNFLPQELETGTCLAFESVDSLVEVRIEDELIYRNLPDDKYTAVDMWNFIILEGNQAEAQIIAEFYTDNALDARILPKMLLGPKSEILLLINTQRSLNVQISMSVVILGLLVFLFSAVTFSSSRSVSDFIILGIFIMLLGVSQLWQIPSPANSLQTGYVQQNIALYCFGILPALYFFYRENRAEDKRMRDIFRTGSWVCFAVFALTLVLHLVMKSPHAAFLKGIIYIYLVAAYGFCLCCTLFAEKNESGRYRLLVSASLCAFLFCQVLEGFTFITYSGSLPVRPLVLGALAFSLLQAIAAVLFAYTHVEEQLALTKELSDSRIRLMVNQIRPHFIRSALAVIRSRIKGEPDRAYDLLYNFTNYLSFNIETLDLAENVPFRDELQHIREYISIEQERFPLRVRAEYDIEADEFLIPPLSIQPFVENAVRHGILARKEGGRVHLVTEEDDDCYRIIVEDNGVGFDPDEPPPAQPGHGVSMKNAVYRIENMAGGTVEIQSVPGEGTTVTVILPREGKGEQDENNTRGR